MCADSYASSKPPSTPSIASGLVARLYPWIAVSEVKELVSYDDRNYLITDGTDKTKFVLKLTNSTDSCAAGILEGQNQMMLHLHHTHHFQSPVPISNVNGDYVTRESIGNDKGK